MIDPLRYRLELRESIFMTGQSGGTVANLAPYLTDYPTVETRWHGPYHMMSIEIRARDSGMRSVVDDAWESWLGYDIVEGALPPSFHGYIVQLDRALGGERERKSIVGGRRLGQGVIEWGEAVSGPLYNAIQVEGASGLTAWATDDTSIRRYGRIEHIRKREDLSSSDAEDVRDDLLRRFSRPIARFLGFVETEPDEVILTITAAGYHLTSSYQAATTELVGATTISDAIRTIIADDCPYLSPGIITPVSQTVDSLKGDNAWMRLTDLAERVSGDYRLLLDEQLKLSFRQQDLSIPNFDILPSGGVASFGDQAPLPTFKITPGIYRNLKRHRRAGFPGFQITVDEPTLRLVTRVVRRGEQYALYGMDTDDAQAYGVQV